MHVKKFIATAMYFEREKAKAPVVEVVAVAAPAKSEMLDRESVDEKFNRLMRESANSLQVSNGLLEQPHPADEK